MFQQQSHHHLLPRQQYHTMYLMVSGRMLSLVVPMETTHLSDLSIVVVHTPLILAPLAIHSILLLTTEQTSQRAHISESIRQELQVLEMKLEQ